MEMAKSARVIEELQATLERLEKVVLSQHRRIEQLEQQVAGITAAKEGRGSAAEAAPHSDSLMQSVEHRLRANEQQLHGSELAPRARRAAGPGRLTPDAPGDGSSPSTPLHGARGSPATPHGSGRAKPAIRSAGRGAVRRSGGCHRCCGLTGPPFLGKGQAKGSVSGRRQTSRGF